LTLFMVYRIIHTPRNHHQMMLKVRCHTWHSQNSYQPCRFKESLECVEPKTLQPQVCHK
jgi:hypothetical protein